MNCVAGQRYLRSILHVGVVTSGTTQTQSSTAALWCSELPWRPSGSAGVIPHGRKKFGASRTAEPCALTSSQACQASSTPRNPSPHTTITKPVRLLSPIASRAIAHHLILYFFPATPDFIVLDGLMARTRSRGDQRHARDTRYIICHNLL